MAQKKGQTGNPNGRPKGTPNKVTQDLKSAVKTFLENNIEKLQKDFDKLDSYQRLLFMEKLLKYAIPVESHSKIDFGSMTEDQLNETIKRLEESILKGTA